MKEIFKGYFTPSEEEYESMWEECIFAFDANVLIDIYGENENAKDKFFEILTNVSDRIWLPHQAAMEYLRRRITYVLNHNEDVRTLVSVLDKGIGDVEKAEQLCSDLKNQFDFVYEIEILEIYKQERQQLHESIKELQEIGLDDDPILKRYLEIFNKKFGKAYSEERLNEICKEAKIRYSRKIPPGYMDEQDPSKHDPFGDVIIWYQIIDKIIEENKPLIFITNEKKEDWWVKDKRKRMFGPRPELRQEIYQKTGNGFYLYRLNDFMSRSRKYLAIDIDEKTISDIEKHEDEKERTEEEELLKAIGRRLRYLPTFPSLGALKFQALESPLAGLNITAALDSTLAGVNLSKTMGSLGRIWAEAMEASQLTESLGRNWAETMKASQLNLSEIGTLVSKSMIVEPTEEEEEEENLNDSEFEEDDEDHDEEGNEDQ